MLYSMRGANLEPPLFEDRRSSFKVTFRNHTLLNPSAITWLNQYAQMPLNDRQRLALVYLHQNEQITNSEYRRLNHVDQMTASQELRDLVQTNLIEQHGLGRWTHYTLRVEQKLPEQLAPETDENKILAFVREHGSITNIQCRQLLDVNEPRAYYLLKKLSDDGHLKPNGKSKARRYVLAE
jgi:predicted HTH transcriptional regulator